MHNETLRTAVGAASTPVQLAGIVAPSQPQHAAAALSVCQLGGAAVAAAVAQAQQQPCDHGEAVRV
eukprot:6661348-Prymnesium_polylepis.1